MDKTEILQALVEKLETDLAKATDAAIDSAESATHEESRSEGKYDTRGLETSYLASGQARYAVELREGLAAVKRFHAPAFSSSDPIALGALVTTLSPQGRETYFLVPGIGGIEVGDNTDAPVTVVSSKSPIGSALIGKRVGDRIEIGGGKTVLSVT